MKVYIITIHEIFDFEHFQHDPMAFYNFEDAKTELKNIADVVLAENEKYGYNDWEVEQTDTSFSTYPEGYWGTSHYDAKISEVEIQ